MANFQTKKLERSTENDELDLTLPPPPPPPPAEDTITVFSKVKGVTPSNISKTSAKNLFNILTRQQYDVVFDEMKAVTNGYVNKYSLYTLDSLFPTRSDLSQICVFSEDKKLIEVRNNIIESILGGEKPAEITIINPESTLTVSKVQAMKLSELLKSLKEMGYELRITAWNKDHVEMRLFEPNYNSIKLHESLKPIGGRVVGNAFQISINEMKDSTSWDKSILPKLEVELSRTNYNYRKSLTDWIATQVNENNISSLVTNALYRPSLGLKLGDEYRFANGLMEVLLKKGELTKEELLPVKVPLLRTLERLERKSPGAIRNLSKNDAILVATEIAKELISLRNEKLEEVFVDKDYKLVVILGSEDVFNEDIYKNFAKNLGIPEDRVKLFKFKDNQSAFLKKDEMRGYLAAIGESGEKALIMFYAHGVEEFKAIHLATENKNDVVIGPKEIADDLGRKKNHEKLRVVFNDCFSHELAEEFGGMLGNSSPYTFTFAPRGTVTFLTHGESLLLEKSRENGTEGLKFRDIYEIDHALNENLDTAVLNWSTLRKENQVDAYFHGSDMGIFVPEAEKVIRNVQQRLKERGIKIPNLDGLLEVSFR